LADLAGANLKGAKLGRARLNQANLTGAKLPGADLRGARLAGAKLSGADLRAAMLNGQNLLRRLLYEASTFPMLRPMQGNDPMAERLALLTQTGPETDMGRLLRLFWQPVATSHSIKSGAARPLRVMGEDLTLYRGESG